MTDYCSTHNPKTVFNKKQIKQLREITAYFKIFGQTLLALEDMNFNNAILEIIEKQVEDIQLQMCNVLEKKNYCNCILLKYFDDDATYDKIAKPFQSCPTMKDLIKNEWHKALCDCHLKIVSFD